MTTANNHQVHAFSYATATTREAATGLVAADVGKLALQQSDNSYWVLQNHSSVTWCQLTHGFVRVKFDATAGVTAGTYDLEVTLPDNAYIVRAWYKILITFQSATDAATIELGIDTDDPTGIVAAIAINDVSTPWTIGLHEAIQDGTVANFTVKTTAARKLIVDVTTEDLTAGELNLFIEYQVSA
jgi:hypothetical protein